MRSGTDRSNGVGTEALARLGAEAATNPERRRVRFGVSTTWMGGVRSDSRVEAREVGGRRVPADFILRVDEPEALGGADTAPTPHELLLAALNACLVASFAAASAAEGIVLHELVVTTRSVVDLGSALGVATVDTPACERLESTVRLRADASTERLRALHDSVVSRSPNGWCLSRPVAIDTVLVIEPEERQE